MTKNQNIFNLCTIFLFFVFTVDLSKQLTECGFSNNSSNPCVHGICLEVNNSQGVDYQCYCNDGYTGINCTKIYDQCLHQNPCLNNAICINPEIGYEVKCLCAPGFCGKYCEFEVNECLSNPCANGGLCIDKVNDYECKCMKGYSGKHCETDINVCINQNSTQNQIFGPTLCLNGGTCVEGPGDRFFCACDPGYSGQRCEYKIRECDSKPCLNGGNCEEKDSDYYCHCNLGWTGKTCEMSLVECTQNLCQNNGICLQINGTQSDYKNVSQNDRTFCYCLPDFYGQYCQHKYNDCIPNPCLNEGLCIDGIDSYVCKCNQRFAGSNCQIDCSEPINELLCVVPTIPMTAQPTMAFTSIISSFENSIEIYSSVYNQIYSSINELNYSIIEWTETPIITASDTFHSSLLSVSTMMSTSLLSITATQTKSYKPEFSPTLTEPNTTVPTSPSFDMKVFIPRFNGFNSSLIYRSKRIKRDFVSISLNLKTDENSTGIIPVLYTKNKHNLELLIYLENNLLRLLVSKKTKQILYIETDLRITAKVFNKVDTKLWITSNKRLNFIISVNNSPKTGGYREIENDPEFCSFVFYYFGEMAANSHQLIENHSNIFSGCLQNVFINNYEFFLSEAIKVKDISECNLNLSNICGENANPCRNGGICENSEDNWNCICPKGFRGDLCETAYCSEQVCFNEGICILPDYGTYLCVCPHGWVGKNCQKKSNQTFASFNSKPNKKSYIKYNLQNLTNHLEIKFRFATQTPDQTKALILFMSNERNGSENQKPIIDFISITLDSSVLYFTINLGHGEKTLWSPIDPQLSEQLVFIGHHKQFVWLIVVPDDIQKTKPIVGKTPLSYKILDVSPHLYVGGHESFKGHPFLKHLNGFKGCIYEIEIRNQLNNDFEMISNEAMNKSMNIEICKDLDNCSQL